MSANDIDPESASCGGGLSAFKEVDEIQHLMQQLYVPDQPIRVMEKNLDRFCFIMKQYQDQPQLLDPYLESLLGPLLTFIKERSEFDYLKHYVFKYIYIIMSVKTYKKIAIHLPHEVTDFNPVLEMLEKQNNEDKDNWQTRYVLLIWLSIISKIPFALSRLETRDSTEAKESLTERVISICKKYCASKDSCSNAAIFLMTHFLTRSDVKDDYMEHLIDWALQGSSNDCLNHRPLAVIASIIKHSCRDDIMPYTQKIFDRISENKLDESSADLVRKFSIKIVQRIGMTLLKVHVNPWQYKKASKAIILSTNVLETRENMEPVSVGNDIFVSYYDDHEIPPLIEEIIEHLIRCLQDKSIIIRWSAAKGIGRITARLPSDLADDVLGYVIDLFSTRESETAWHGGCLALAELGRRGLLLPDRLKEIIPLVIQALVFDEPRAYGPVGSIIRDAACFVCWSFARAFEPEVFQPHVNDISRALLIVTCFDREINCRRAGSAAFQENVGRQGNFPHGIEIISAADYFEVGVRSNAYLKISVHVAKYEGYLKPLVDHLVKRKVTHWDSTIRELAAKALHNLGALDTTYIINDVFPVLLDFVNSLDSFARHGAILAIAEILVVLHQCLEKDISDIIAKDHLDKIQKIVSTCRSRGQLRGLGGESIKQACATLIKKFSIVHFHVNDENIINDWQGLLEECLSNEVAIVREVSAEAHTAFFTEYYLTWSLEDRQAIINKYLENLQSSSQTVRIGFAEAIGYFPVNVLKEKGEDIFKKLMQCSCITKDTTLWAESRRDAIRSLTKLSETLGLEHTTIWKPFVSDVYRCLFNGLAEYTNDSRGDIGSWVREAAIDGILTLTRLVFKADYTEILTQELMTKIIGGIAQQAVERIDRTRSKAGNAFHVLIQSSLPNIPHHEELKILFLCTDEKKFIDWRSESETFPLFIQMLSFQPYVQNLLKGIIYSAGGLSESLVKYSSMSLFSYLQQLDEQTLSSLCNEICNIFESCHGDDRMISASLAFLDRLISSGCIQGVLDDPKSEIPKRILTLLKKESKCINAIQSQLNSVKLFCHMLQVHGPVSKGAFSQLSIYLCHKFKFIRKATASRLYESLTLHGDEMDVSEEDLAILLTQLNTVDWEEPVEKLRPIRNQLCEIMKCSIPTVVQRPKNN
ncbi:tubulin-specific chaperone D [Copidosoma floridanum]|uniref:tubulin-specific chaperone D n=1 Tax=Copidosoma floridanum TaxID=29053 RepID=UPI0006C9A5DC|nr:tubulin-specific chaperone D [Copidosoma floridanum]